MELATQRLIVSNAKPAPAILVVPADLHVARADIIPPLFKLLARNVERRGRDQMIEDDRVLLAPAKPGDRFQVIVVEKMLRDAPLPIAFSGR